MRIDTYNKTLFIKEGVSLKDLLVYINDNISEKAYKEITIEFDEESKSKKNLKKARIPFEEPIPYGFDPVRPKGRLRRKVNNTFEDSLYTGTKVDKSAIKNTLSETPSVDDSHSPEVPIGAKTSSDSTAEWVLRQSTKDGYQYLGVYGSNTKHVELANKYTKKDADHYASDMPSYEVIQVANIDKEELPEKASSRVDLSEITKELVQETDSDGQWVLRRSSKDGHVYFGKFGSIKQGIDNAMKYTEEEARLRARNSTVWKAIKVYK